MTRLYFDGQGQIDFVTPGTNSSILRSIDSMRRVTAKMGSKSVEISFPFRSKRWRHTPQVWAR
jgi:hypothetical protein